MTNSKYVPKRRFKEFESDGEWVKRELGDVSTSYSGGTPTVGNREYYGDEIPFIRSAEINSEFTELSLTKIGLEKSSAKMVNIGDILYALYGATSGEVGISKIKGAINQAVLCIIPQSEYDSNFIVHWLRFQKENIINTYLQGGQGNLSGSMVKELDINFPKLSEQRKIGKLFQRLDRLISLHQHKLDKLKDLKKAYLTEMFPVEGEHVPKRRFPGFEGEWEEKKLSEVVKEFIVPMRDKPKEFSGNIPWTRIDDIEGKYISRSLKGHCVSLETVKRMNLKIIPEDSLIVSASATFGTVAIVKNDLITNQTFIGLVPKNKYEVEFLFYLFQSPKVRNYMKEESAGSTIFYISRESFEKMEIDLPDENERKLISKHLRTVDSLITLQQQKLDKLNDLKKAYLNELFV